MTKKDPVAVELGRRGGKKGGKARAASMTRDQRRELGRLGAVTRWAKAKAAGETIPKAVAEGVLPNSILSGVGCAVLDDERRVLSRRGVGRALGLSHGGKSAEAGGELPFFLAAQSLQPFISEELRAVISNPILYETSGGIAYGAPAEVLPQILNVWVSARAAGALKRSQLAIADRANAMLVALAGVAMVALVDEATGYQSLRARDALAQILEKFIAKEMQGWARTFEPEFYEYLFRLQGWKYDPTSVHRPRRAGQLTTDIVYQRLAPGVRTELKRLAKEYRLQRGLRYQPHLHRGLTREHGWIKLREHLASVTTLMDVAPNWGWFIEKLDRRHPRYGDSLLLPFRVGDEAEQPLPESGEV